MDNRWLLIWQVLYLDQDLYGDILVRELLSSQGTKGRQTLSDALKLLGRSSLKRSSRRRRA